MGRYATFKNDKHSVHYEHKFWFGIQDSDIPWADNREDFYILPYDEEQATTEEYSSEMRELWQKYQNESTADIKEYEENEVLQALVAEVGESQFSAQDTDADLPEYWSQTQALIKSFDLPEFVYDAEKPLDDLLDDYYNAHIQPLCSKLYELKEQQSNTVKSKLGVADATLSDLSGFFKVRDTVAAELGDEAADAQLRKLADLHIKIIICSVLARCGSYVCYYDC